MNNLQNKIDGFISKNNVPNLLIYGKNSHHNFDLVNYFINNVYGPEEHKNKYVLNINCISLKGIKTIKDNIKLFSSQIINNKSNIKFKSVVLRFAEFLTYDSQYSLRRTIEQFSHHTRFIMVCENKNLLLTPILSRFVHIYVNIPSSSKLNLETNTRAKLDSFMKTYKTILNENDDNNILKQLFQLAKEMYEENILCAQLLNKFEKHENYFSVKMMFPKISTNIKNETMTLFYILNIFRNNSNIEIFDLY